MHVVNHLDNALKHRSPKICNPLLQLTLRFSQSSHPLCKLQQTQKKGVDARRKKYFYLRKRPSNLKVTALHLLVVDSRTLVFDKQ